MDQCTAPRATQGKRVRDTGHQVALDAARQMSSSKKSGLLSSTFSQQSRQQSGLRETLISNQGLTESNEASEGFDTAGDHARGSENLPEAFFSQGHSVGRSSGLWLGSLGRTQAAPMQNQSTAKRAEPHHQPGLTQIPETVRGFAVPTATAIPAATAPWRTAGASTGNNSMAGSSPAGAHLAAYVGSATIGPFLAAPVHALASGAASVGVRHAHRGAGDHSNSRHSLEGVSPSGGMLGSYRPPEPIASPHTSHRASSGMIDYDSGLGPSAAGATLSRGNSNVRDTGQAGHSGYTFSQPTTSHAPIMAMSRSSSLRSIRAGTKEGGASPAAAGVPHPPAMTPIGTELVGASVGPSDGYGPVSKSEALLSAGTITAGQQGSVIVRIPPGPGLAQGHAGGYATDNSSQLLSQSPGGQQAGQHLLQLPAAGTAAAAIAAGDANADDTQRAWVESMNAEPKGGWQLQPGATSSSGVAFGAPARPLAPSKSAQSSNLKAIVYGLINAVVGLPSLIALAAIVFQAPVYSVYLASLSKFLFLASAVHQLVLVLLSTQPFVVCQVQDVGLIFLSAMASSIAADGSALGLSTEKTLGTALVTLAGSCAIVGALMMAVGRLRLAQLVQYVPLPVVGGYLGYVGYFCVAGGIALGTSTTIDTLPSWLNLIDKDAALKLVPTLGTCAALMATMEFSSHPLALPAVLVTIPLIFHAVRLAAGWSMEDIQEAGWALQPPEGGADPLQLWSLLNLGEGLSGIYWPSVWKQAPKLAGLFLVVCFGSCMDLAAVAQEMSTGLDFNYELVTIGLANLLVGTLGAGFTGSYIFSQTVFTMRAGVHNRLNGMTLALSELFVFALPFSVVQYCPSFFFGALLLWFGVEISRDWLVLSSRKLSVAEYVLLWLTFGFIMVPSLGLMGGIAVGVVAATLYFAVEYAKSQVSLLRVVAASSGRMHSYEEAALLELLAERVATCALTGFLFFGSALTLSDRVKQVADKLLSGVADTQQAAYAAVAGYAAELEQKQAAAGADADGNAEGVTSPEHLGPIAQALYEAVSKKQKEQARQSSEYQQHQQHHHDHPQHSRAQSSGGGGIVLPGGLQRAQLPASLHWAGTVLQMADAPISLILDMRQVTQIDATGARTFSSLVSDLSTSGINVVFAGLSSRATGMRALLSAHGVHLRALPPAHGTQAVGYMHGSDSTVRLAIPGSTTSLQSLGAAGSAARKHGNHHQLQHQHQQSQQERSTSNASSQVSDPLLEEGGGGVQQQLQCQQVEALEPGTCWEFPSLEDAVGYVEQIYLGTAVQRGLLPPPKPVLGLRDVVERQALELPLGQAQQQELISRLHAHFGERVLHSGQALFHEGQEVPELFLVQQGRLQLSITGAPSTDTAAPGASPQQGTTRGLSTVSVGGAQASSRNPSQPPLSVQQPAASGPPGPPANLHPSPSFSFYPQQHARQGHSIQGPAADTLTQSGSRMAIGRGGSADSSVQQTASAEAAMVQQGQQEQELEQQGVEDAVAGCTGELLSRNAVFGPGCLVAAQDFFLRRPASATAVCASPRCTLLALTRGAVDRMMQEDPAALNLLLLVAMRVTCLELSTTLDLLERNSLLQ